MASNAKRPRRVAPSEHPSPFTAFHPVKPREPGRTKTVVGDALRQAGGPKRVAAFLHRSESTVYGYADEQAERADLSLDQARDMTRFLHVTAFAEDFAALAGGAFMPLSDGEPALIAKLASLAQKQGGDFYAALIAAIDDGVITKTERLDLIRLIAPHIKTLVGMQTTLLHGENS